MIAVAEALRGAGGIYVTHMRDEADDVLQSIEETLRIGRAVNAPVVISHHKCAMPENYGRSLETLPRIEPRRAAQRVDFDVYPYAAGSTVLMPRPLAAGRAGADHLVGPAPGNRRPHAGRYRAPSGASTPRDAAERLLPAGAIFFQMDEQDVQRILAHRAGDDRQRRPAARRIPASAPVGHLPARARPLCARSRPVQHGRRRCTR